MTLNEALYILLIIAEIVLLAWMSFYILSLIFSWLKGAPYVATRKDELNAILTELKLKPGQVFLELGCGDGRVTRMAVQQYHVQGRGVDINPMLIWKAQLLAKVKGLNQTTFKRGNILDENLSQVDVMYVYLFPKLVESLKSKMLTEVKEDTLIVSHGFKIPYLAPYQKNILQGIRFKTYIYQKSFDKRATEQL